MLAALILTLVLVVGAGAVYLESNVANQEQPERPRRAGRLARQLTPAARRESPDTAGAGSLRSPRRSPSPPLCRDGRVTVLLLGSDNRPNEPVGRTDTMMVLTVDPLTHRPA